MDRKKIGLFIAELRRQRGYTQRELAERLMVTDKAVSRWETGRGLPDAALLGPLSRELGVSVGELLAGETFGGEQPCEQVDDVILEALRYSRGQALCILEAVLLLLGAALVLSPLYLAVGGLSFYVLAGIAVLVLDVGLVIKGRTAWKFPAQAAYPAAMLCLLCALALELLPCGAVLIFAPGPGERLRRTFSYFDLTVFGYANFTPLLTGCMTVLTLVLGCAVLFGRGRFRRLANAVFTISCVTLLMSVLPLVLFGADYMTAVGCAVGMLLVLSICLQAAANRGLQRR